MSALRLVSSVVVASGLLIACVGDTATTDDGGTDSGGGDSATEASKDATNDTANDAANDVAQETGPVACTGTCVPQLPVGWSGPVAIAIGAPNTIPTACGNGLGSQSVSGNSQLQQENATCSSCNTSPTGQYCKVIGDLDYEVSPPYNCSSPNTPNYDISQYGACAPIYAFGQNATTNLHNPYTIAGTCTPPAQNPTVPPPKWGQAAIGCDMLPATGTCSTGNVCKGTPPSPFGGQACVYSAGDVACPAGYDQGFRGVVYSGVIDNRTCTSCGATYHDSGCTGSLVGNNGSNCTGSTGGTITWGGNWTVSSPISCYGFGVSVKNNMTVLNPGCTVSGGQPSGTIAPDATKATTVCCTQ